MNNIKILLVKASAAVMFMALISLNLNINSFPEDGFSSIGFSIEAHSAHAQCPTCPSEDELKMETYFCSTGEATLRCYRGGSGCDISGQTTCPDREEA